MGKDSSEDKRKVTIGILDHSAEIGGAEISILTLLKNYNLDRFHIKMILSAKGRLFRVLKEMGIETLYIPLASPLRRMKRGHLVSSFFLLFAYLFSFKIFLLRLTNAIKKEKFDLLVTNTIKAHFYGSLISLWLNTPLIWRFHDILSDQDFHPLLIKLLVCLGNRLPKKILAVSEETRKSLIHYGIRSDKIRIIYNGVDIEKLQGQNESNSLWMEKEKREVKIGCFGRIVPQKGHQVLLSSIPKVLSSFPHTKFFIAGDTPEGYQSYRTKLMEIIQEKRLKENVSLMDFCNDIHSLYNEMDMVVLPSISPEAFGLTILEAMAFGKPVIASKTGGVHELIMDGVNGFLVKPNNDEELAQRINFLLGHPEVCQWMGQKAKEIVQEKFPLKKYIEAMEESFLNVLSWNGESI